MPITSRPFLKIAALLILFFATNAYHSYEDSGRRYGSGDVNNYLSLSMFGPNQDLVSYFNHRQRFVFPRLSGILAERLGIDVYTGFRLVNTFLLITGFIFMIKALRQSRIQEETVFLSAAVMLFNPYYLRYHLAHAGMVVNTAFICGASLTSYGLTSRKRFFIYAGLIIAALSKQVVICLLPAVLIWILSDSGWKNLKFSSKVVTGLVSTLLVVSVLCLTGWYAGFKGPEAVSRAYAVDRWFLWNLFSADQLKAIPMLIFQLLTMFGVPLGILTAQGAGIFSRRMFIALTGFLILMMQNFVFAPASLYGNIMRYSSLAFPFFVIMFAYAVDRSFNFRSDKFPTAIILTALFISSLHHQNSFMVVFGFPNWMFAGSAMLMGFTVYLILKYRLKYKP